MRSWISYHVHRYAEKPSSGFAYARQLLKQGGVILLAGKTLEAVWLRLLMAAFSLTKNARKKEFQFCGDAISYFSHSYNEATWNERTIEIPIATLMIMKHKNEKILEVGAVLNHYQKPSWDVLDKYEKGKDILNLDVVDYAPKEKYDLIVSVSTLEHVGLDEEDVSPEKGIRAVKNLSKCLKKGGTLLATASVGYNKDWDRLLFAGKLGFDKVLYLKRKNVLNEWYEVSEEEAKKCRYGWPFNNANAIAVGILDKN